MKKIYRQPEIELNYFAVDVITGSVNNDDLNQFDDCTNDIFV